MKKKDLGIYKELIDMGQITKPSYKTYTEMTVKKVLFFGIEEAEKYELSDDEIIKTSQFLKNISDKAT